MDGGSDGDYVDPYGAIRRSGIYSGGAGTEADPYRIGIAADWQTLAATTGDWDKYFVLIGT